MSQPSNKVISFSYELVDFNTKEKLDSTTKKDPLEFISGKGHIIQDLEDQLLSMCVGDKKEVKVEPSKAYGEYDKESIQTLPKEQFAGIQLKEGMSLYGSGENGQNVHVRVTSFNDKDVTIDYNHPMAGKTLLFFVELLKQRPATKDEISSGMVGGFKGGTSCAIHSNSQDKSTLCC